MNRIAIYPGTFDPPTLGHQDVLRRARDDFGEVLVVLAVNEGKRPLLTIGQRADLWNHIGALVAVAKDGEAAFETAQRLGADWIVRGFRGPVDYPGESAFSYFVSKNSDVGVKYYQSTTDLVHVSSSAVRAIMGLNNAKKFLRGWLDDRIISDLQNLGLVGP